MKKWLPTTLALVLLATPAWAETIHVGVNGLVCAFCVKGIESGFRKQPGVQDVAVDLDSKLITLTTDGSVSDASITQTISDAGYNTISIHHMK